MAQLLSLHPRQQTPRHALRRHHQRLIIRVEQHRAGKGSAFTRNYRVHLLVWYEEFSDVRGAIQREKTIKHYIRAWKINLIERTNPHWVDLYSRCPASLLSQRFSLAEGWVLGTRGG